ncbi:tRNA-dihydrouridine synthase [Histoplasma capsulatum var. duboisii H88]|uniref:tRNA-dihydrouridine synthase n=1 Tax=Ajellomyces capsulatus (strain H88) TaxID=544711 RepID=A0A8A1LQM2_AJEC8|nr:tRNA-dihydrouridine synthase [Histoplasma capsulatum var. duboisii H88]
MTAVASDAAYPSARTLILAVGRYPGNSFFFIGRISGIATEKKVKKNIKRKQKKKKKKTSKRADQQVRRIPNVHGPRRLCPVPKIRITLPI